MSEQPNKPAESTLPVPPAYLPDDLLPAWEWWQRNGTQLLITLLVAALLAVGIRVWLQHRQDRNASASAQLLAQPAIETLEKAVTEYGSTAPGVALQLKLAKSYYDAGKYVEALAKYDDFIRQHGSYPFADIARVGRGFALSGQGKHEEALEAFRTFRAGNPDNYLVPQTILGEAACLAQQGKKDEAKTLLQNFRATRRETPWEAVATHMEGAVDRYKPHAPRSLFDQPPEGFPALPPALPKNLPPAAPKDAPPPVPQDVPTAPVPPALPAATSNATPK